MRALCGALVSLCLEELRETAALHALNEERALCLLGFTEDSTVCLLVFSLFLWGGSGLRKSLSKLGFSFKFQ